MKLLLDTHIAVWLIRDPGLLKPHERRVLDDGRSSFHVSTVSILELRLKWQARTSDGRPKGLIDPADALMGLAANGVPLVPLLAEHCAAVLQSPIDHNDPFDELLLVHAQELGMRLFTRDAALAGHPLAYVAD